MDDQDKEAFKRAAVWTAVISASIGAFSLLVVVVTRIVIVANAVVRVEVKVEKLEKAQGRLVDLMLDQIRKD